MNFILGIPLFNEEDTILEFFSNLISNLPREIEKIIVINDGSTDNSKFLLEKLKENYKFLEIKHHYPNQGYGFSIIQLMFYAKKEQYDFLITMDCDKQHKVEDLIKFINFDYNIDVVSGSRYREDSPSFGIKPPEDRVRINQKITKKLNEKYKFSLTDSFCGFKRYKLKKINPELFTEKGYGFPLEFWTYCYYYGLTLKEIPVARIYITDDRSFGEDLDKYKKRYKYYLKVWKNSEKKFSSFYANRFSI